MGAFSRKYGDHSHDNRPNWTPSGPIKGPISIIHCTLLCPSVPLLTGRTCLNTLFLHSTSVSNSIANFFHVFSDIFILCISSRCNTSLRHWSKPIAELRREYLWRAVNHRKRNQQWCTIQRYLSSSYNSFYEMARHEFNMLGRGKETESSHKVEAQRKTFREK